MPHGIGFSLRHKKFGLKCKESVVVIDNNNDYCFISGASAYSYPYTSQFVIYKNNEILGDSKSIPIPFQRTPTCMRNNEIHIFGSVESEFSYNMHYIFKDGVWKWDTTLIPYNFINGDVVYSDEIDAFFLLGNSASSQGTNFYMCKPTNTTSYYEYVQLSANIPFTYDYCMGQSVIHNGAIHILGSYIGTKKQHYKIDLSSVSSSESVWEEVSTLPYNFYYGTTQEIDGKIHIFGGYGDGNGHYVFDDDSATWIKLNDLPISSTNGMLSFTYHGNVYIISETSMCRYDSEDGIPSVYTLPKTLLKGSIISVNDEYIYTAVGTTINKMDIRRFIECVSNNPMTVNGTALPQNTIKTIEL